MKTRIIILIATILFGGSSLTAQQNRQLVQEDSSSKAESRTALVIGNGSYADSPLKNPPNDATDVAQALKTLGFEVLSFTNLDQNAMKKAIREFGAKLRSKGGVGLFYYAGHGVQAKGKNYLIPVGATVNTEEEVEYESVEVGLVLAQMESANNNINIVILDACRNNPFARSFRSADKGLASIDAPSGTLLAYSTAPGSVASDGTGRNGLYTQELLKAIRTDGLSIEDVFKRVRVSVRGSTENRQTPWESSSLTGNFFFTAKTKAAPIGGDSNAEESAKTNSFAPSSAAPVNKPMPPVNKVTLKEIELSFKSNLFDETIQKARTFLETEPDNVDANGYLGVSLLAKKDVDGAVVSLAKIVNSGQAMPFPVKRGRQDALKIGFLLGNAQITIAKTGVTIVEGDKTFQANMSDLSETRLENYQNQCPQVYIKGAFVETRAKSDKTKSEMKEFWLFPMSAQLQQVQNGNLMVNVIACQDEGILTTTIVKLLNRVRIEN